ncbi:hypothetical protein BUALT_Bualt14G0122600 [Buddleja alternifolia]|uniref:Uncharacterized protein n=1 Tax=Buddleja alternifolia TaxID=168488 RepID=A0AAV6WK68_9LAMI|nr:hypothetical protein BUALT_Bualt14G0122600 [Buddleja alternifolia]
MDTRNCCTGCAGVDTIYSCSNPIRRTTVVPVTSNAVNFIRPGMAKNEGNVGRATVPKESVTVKKEEPVKVPTISS